MYWKNEHPRFPDGGKMSQHLESLPIGGEMEVKGPLGHVHYLGPSKYATHFGPFLLPNMTSVHSNELRNTECITGRNPSLVLPRVEMIMT